MQIGDIVVLQEDNMVPTKWPLAKVVQVHEGRDKLVRVVSIKTVTKLLPSESPLIDIIIVPATLKNHLVLALM